MKYRKRPVVVDAFQITAYTRFHNENWPEWLNAAWNRDPLEEGAVHPGSEDGTPKYDGRGTLIVRTKEGFHVCSENDWIIKGVKDELYPCKPDIFELTYLPAGELDPQEVSRAQTAIALHLIECQATTTEVAIAVGACLAEKALRAAHGENRP